jgi:tRNA G18 (ribose-2'-O)-methylase SpoU
MRGYFGLGVEGISKAGNMGNLLRSAHSFGASFFFAVAPDVDYQELRYTDTSGGWDHMPYYEYDSIADMALPKKCSLVAVELTPDAVDLPSFRHPTQAAYILGPEMGSVSPQMLELCDHTIKIPMKFCVNVGVAGALVMYDRLISNGRFAPRPAKAGGPSPEELKQEMQPVIHRRKIRRKTETL